MYILHARAVYVDHFIFSIFFFLEAILYYNPFCNSCNWFKSSW